MILFLCISVLVGVAVFYYAVNKLADKMLEAIIVDATALDGGEGEDDVNGEMKPVTAPMNLAEEADVLDNEGRVRMECNVRTLFGTHSAFDCPACGRGLK